MSEGFLAVDSILNVMLNVVDGLVVNKKVIGKRVKNELPFMATENIMMELVKRGGDRQKIHEKLRVYSMQAGKQIKEFGLENDLIERIASDEELGLTVEELNSQLEPKKFIGRSNFQVEKFLSDVINPLLEKYKNLIGEKYELKV